MPEAELMTFGWWRVTLGRCENRAGVFDWSARPTAVAAAELTAWAGTRKQKA
jgi:hypothetical protein